MVKTCFSFFVCVFSKKITDKKRLTLTKSSAENNIDIEPNTNTSSNQVSSERHNKSVQDNPVDYCIVCQFPFNKDPDDQSHSKIDNFVSCNHCFSQTCTSPQCAIWLPKHNQWECNNCHHFNSVVYVQAYDWIFEQLIRRFDDKASVARFTETPSKSNDDVMLELNGNCDVLCINMIGYKLKIGHFISMFNRYSIFFFLPFHIEDFLTNNIGNKS